MTILKGGGAQLCEGAILSGHNHVGCSCKDAILNGCFKLGWNPSSFYLVQVQNLGAGLRDGQFMMSTKVRSQQVKLLYSISSLLSRDFYVNLLRRKGTPLEPGPLVRTFVFP